MATPDGQQEEQPSEQPEDGDALDLGPWHADPAVPAGAQ